MTADDPRFSIPLTVRSDDLNFAQHVAHQNYFIYFQEARIAYLGQFGFSELDICGCAMLIAEASCRYRRELFFGDRLQASCRVVRLTPKTFVMAYSLARDGVLCAEGSTTNLVVAPRQKKVVPLPDGFVAAVRAFEGRSLAAPPGP
ncbi:MAG: thioesterase family protein [Desulfobacteraceae bacterium]|jgi:YbgC/YbaW family acyl-CoA thioester hydrolase